MQVIEYLRIITKCALWESNFVAWPTRQSPTLWPGLPDKVQLCGLAYQTKSNFVAWPNRLSQNLQPGLTDRVKLCSLAYQTESKFAAWPNRVKLCGVIIGGSSTLHFVPPT